jgi:hypothetical protein
MFSTLRNRFGIPGVISVIALVFAMFGGAYAASSSSGGGKATASAKAKKGPKGPKGATGPAGPAGPAGAAGAKGDTGVAGSNGTNGTPGSAGAAGKSVISETFEGTDEPNGAECFEAGGVEFEVEGSGTKKYACNGTAGTPGAPGSPWTAGGTLPVGATETGIWSFTSSDPSENSVAFVPLSFDVPLAAELDSTHVVFVGGLNPDPTHCPGTVAEPKAASGYLCVYRQLAVFSISIAINATNNVPLDPEEVGTQGAGTTGAVLRYLVHGEEAISEGIPARGYGSYAVTG